ncbi:MAG: Dam family site-specific DNA-(adenine-N6)-methyltransferase [Acidobacteria bacterium]|nr:Dam family site-specific DNA-(adenine-N6)-methyltransferase [Acidobacteriota bacterium]
MAQSPQCPDTTPARPGPPLKWAGGKRWLVPHVQRLWAPHASSRLVEPFCGGLAVALSLAPDRALLNDVNPHLVNFYRHLKRGLLIRLPMENDSAAFYTHRQRFNELLQAGRVRTVEAASLFYYLNRTGYNGLCRFNSRGQFNVPFGRYARISYTRDFARYVDAFADSEFRSVDFESLRLRPDDFVYADPPYDVPFTQYARGRFSWDDQLRAAHWLARHPGPVVLSNQATPRIVALYKRLGYKLKFLAAPRRISCTGDRAPAREVLATRNLS